MASDFLLITLFAIFSLLIARADNKTGAVPRIAFILAFPVFFTLKTLLVGRSHLLESTIGMLIGFVIFLLVFIILKRKLGLADVWYSALIGMMLGPWWWYAAIGIACLTGIVYMIFLRRRRIPFIPFMAAGSAVVSILQILL